MAETLCLTFLGGLRIARGKEEITGFVSRKAKALLVYLTVTGRVHFRSSLAGLLWGEIPQSRATNNLRVVLSNLRHLFPGYLITTRLTVEFNRNAPYWLDVEEFEKRVRSYESGVRSEESQPSILSSQPLIHNLHKAVELYQGDFLQGFHLPKAPSFEEWMLIQRERLRQMALQALHELVRYHTLRGEYAAGIKYATQLLTLDPWREEAHRELMRLLALTGQRSAALTQYEKCRYLLESELGLEPLEETKALYERIRSMPLFFRPATHLRPSVPLLPFVGRGEEHAILVEWWEAARRGERQLTLIEGEAGVGKTRLVEEVARYVEAQGAVVLRGHCYEFGGSLPYQPFAEAMREQLSQHASRVLNLGKTWLTELSQLLPELREMYPDLLLPFWTPGEAARQRLFEAVARFLLALTQAEKTADWQVEQPVNPLLLFLDDLHWADQATLDLLHYLARRLRGAPIWIVGTYRPEEVSLSHPLTRLRQSLGQNHLVDLLVLKPLSSQAVENLALSLVGEEGSSEFGAFLYRESEGNPFVLSEIIGTLHEQGVLRKAEERGLWHIIGELNEGGMLPSGIRDLVLQRVGRLSEPAQRLLTLAAVIGRRFDTSLLRAAAGPDAEAVDTSLNEWLKHRLVRQIGESRLTAPEPKFVIRDSQIRHFFDFSHDKIRAVVYRAMTVGRRRALHQRVGKALEKLYANHLEAVYEQLAHHYEQAGATEGALTYLPLAAAKAATVYANQKALDYYDRALALLGKEDLRRWKILLEEGKILHFLGKYEEAMAACQQVVEKTKGIAGSQLLAAQAANELSKIYRARRDYDEAKAWAWKSYRLAEGAGEIDRLEEQAQAKQNLGLVECEQGNLEAAQRQFEEALTLYRSLGDQHGVADCLSGLGRILSTKGFYDTARRQFEKALAIFQGLGDRQNEAACLRTIGVTYWRQGANDAAQEAFTESLDICRAIGDHVGEAYALNDLGLVHIARGNHNETRRCWEKSAALFRSLGLENRAAVALHRLSILHMSRGNYAAARECLEESLAIHRATDAKPREALDLGWLGNLHFSQGQYEDAHRCLEEALALDQEIGGGEEEVWHLTWLGGVAYETGDMAQAEGYLRKAIQLAQERGTDLRLHEAYCRLAAVHLAQGNGEAALTAARQALAEAQAGDELEAIGSCYSILGAVYSSGLVKETEDPSRYFERALGLLEEGNPFWYGVALRRYGAYLLHSGDRERGQARLREAEAIFRRLGAQGELNKVTRLLAGDDSPRLRY